jgi:hypothetical protein
VNQRKISAVCVLALLCLPCVPAQTAPAIPPATPSAPQNTAPQNTDQQPSISLSPAVVMARGSFGQGLTQTLTLNNLTGLDFAFELIAEDVVIKDGKRVFVSAGETEHSIAATAVFSQSKIVIKAHSSGSVDVRLTIPPQTKIRAMVAIFRGTDVLRSSTPSVGMTASLGALLTFNLTDNVKLDPDPVQIKPANESSNLVISQWITNSGTEPAVPEGVAAILSTSGSLVGKAPFSSQRLLPGERLEFAAEYPEQLNAGNYRVLCSFQFEGKTLTKDTTFKIP